MFNNRGTKLHSNKAGNVEHLKAKSHRSEGRFFHKPESETVKTVGKALAVLGAIGVGAAVAVKVRSKKKDEKISHVKKHTGKKIKKGPRKASRAA